MITEPEVCPNPACRYYDREAAGATAGAPRRWFRRCSSGGLRQEVEGEMDSCDVVGSSLHRKHIFRATSNVFLPDAPKVEALRDLYAQARLALPDTSFPIARLGFNDRDIVVTNDVDLRLQLFTYNSSISNYPRGEFLERERGRDRGVHPRWLHQSTSLDAQSARGGRV